MPSNLPRLTVRLPQETIDKLKEIAEAEHRSTNEQIHHILDNYIKNYIKKKHTLYYWALCLYKGKDREF